MPANQQGRVKSAVIADALFDGTGAEPRRDAAVVFAGGVIEAIRPVADLSADTEIIAHAPVVTPGLIDLQINGAGGVLFNDAPTPQTLATMAAAARRGGTAYFLPTYVTAHGQGFIDAMRAVETAISQGQPGILGIHLEGPFLSPKRPGIHPKDAIRVLDGADIEALGRDIGGPRLITLAPEEAPPSAIATLKQNGAVLFAGHSEAGFDTMVEAESQGLTGATHLFNAMSQITGREPGVVGSVFDSKTLFAGIIADGVHVHPSNLRLAFRSLGAERLFLVTDAMPTLGTTITEFDLLGKKIHLDGLKLLDSKGTLAGAHIALDACVQNAIELAGATPAQAVQMATSTPARAIGMEHRIGRIAPGYSGTVTLMDKTFAATDVIYSQHDQV